MDNSLRSFPATGDIIMTSVESIIINEAEGISRDVLLADGTLLDETIHEELYKQYSGQLPDLRGLSPLENTAPYKIVSSLLGIPKPIPPTIFGGTWDADYQVITATSTSITVLFPDADAYLVRDTSGTMTEDSTEDKNYFSASSSTGQPVTGIGSAPGTYSHSTGRAPAIRFNNRVIGEPLVLKNLKFDFNNPGTNVPATIWSYGNTSDLTVPKKVADIEAPAPSDLGEPTAIGGYWDQATQTIIVTNSSRDGVALMGPEYVNEYFNTGDLTGVAVLNVATDRGDFTYSTGAFATGASARPANDYEERSSGVVMGRAMGIRLQDSFPIGARITVLEWTLAGQGHVNYKDAIVWQRGADVPHVDLVARANVTAPDAGVNPPQMVRCYWDAANKSIVSLSTEHKDIFLKVPASVWDSIDTGASYKIKIVCGVSTGLSMFSSTGSGVVGVGSGNEFTVSWRSDGSYPGVRIDAGIPIGSSIPLTFSLTTTDDVVVWSTE